MFSGSISQWLKSDKFADLQDDMLNDRINDGCRSCLNNEKSQGVSTRLGALKEYKEHYTDTNIDYIDYRSSNVCNFRCRTCEPFYSHGIANDVKKSEFLLSLYNIPDTKTVSTQEEDKTWIINNLANIKRLMFTGGEPTLIPEVKEIIESVRGERYEDISILIITNGSFTDNYWLDLAGMHNVNWTVSIDAIGANAEIVRHGTDWKQIDKNIRFLAENSSSLNFSTVISNLNLLHLGELFKYTRSIREQYRHRPNGKTQFMSICNFPEYLNPYNWPPALKHQALVYLQYDVLSKIGEHEDVVRDLIRNIQQYEYNDELWQLGKKYNSELDSMRKQDSSKLFS
jgi:organic radical activating enzyme